MALVEIEDSVLAELQKKAGLADAAAPFQAIFDKIGKSKDRQTLLKLVKEHYPETVIPEIDAAEPLKAEIEALKKQLAEEKAALAKEKEEEEKKRAERRAERTIAEARKKLREEGWDDEGIEKIEAYMREKGNPDYDSAAAYIRSTLPKETALPSTFAGQRFGWFDPPKDDVDHTLLMKNPRAYQDQQIQKWLAEKRGRRVA